MAIHLSMTHALWAGLVCVQQGDPGALEMGDWKAEEVPGDDAEEEEVEEVAAGLGG